MDFYFIKAKSVRKRDEERIEISPDFIVGHSNDLMIRGGGFYAIWDEEKGLWSTNEYDVARLVDADLHAYAEKHYDPGETSVKSLRSFDSLSWTKFRKYAGSIANSYEPLDERIIFSGQEVKKNDYASKTLPYALEAGDHSAWDELIGTLYSDEEKAKIEWAIGAVVSGDSKTIQKFLVFYGAPGTGKSTILNIIHKMFYEYTTVFEAKALASANNSFSTEAFKSNPLVAIQHDGDLSRIEDNTKLNSIIAHEDMLINEKYKAGYMARVNAMLFIGTNQPVKISDARSGIIRRLIDVNPTGNRIPQRKYQALLKQINFELGAIAHHCLTVYERMGVHYYDSYRPMEMMYKTDTFFNFVEAHYDILATEGGVSLKQAWALYKEYAEDARLSYSLQMSRFREELKDYFKTFEHRKVVDGVKISSWFSDFDKTKFEVIRDIPTVETENPETLKLEETESIFDEEMARQPAQYANSHGTPAKKWDSVDTVLHDIKTSRIHYVQVPENHIVIDFDLKDADGNKSKELNLAAASLWPATYAEFSQGDNGIHLHYTYEGDVHKLASIYSEGIEVKTLLGDASLRRRLTKCNNVPINQISSGLPFKEKKVISEQTIKSEKGVRDLIARNLRKEIHPGTKPSIDFIHKILEDAYSSKMKYDVSDLRPRIVAFANNSTNQPLQCLKIVQTMKFQGAETTEEASKVVEPSDGRISFYDVEVYPNLLVICWKFRGSDDVVVMLNPSSAEVEQLFKLKLVGFYNRRYDNHILYARFMGYSLEEIYNLSQRITSNDPKALFGEAYNLSYTDIYDFSSKKTTLKRFEIDLGLYHMELDLPWDEPVDDADIPRVVEYCKNDVIASEAVFESRKGDFLARQILAELSGLTVNDTTQKHTARIIFGKDRTPQSQFVYTDLSKEFPGYTFDSGKSLYRGENPSEGGYVYAEPGIYSNVAVLDVASMHPASIENLNLFGTEYTKRYSDLKNARLAIKHGDYTAAREMLDGRLKPYLEDETQADMLAYALKIVVNIVYGLTSAKFDNPFRDIRNKDNIVAKRGALFMIDLKHFVWSKGYKVAHIKTDSIKIPDADDKIIQEVMAFGAKYGYTFEHEVTYDKLCLVNDAVYIAKKENGAWDAVGAQFQHPYVYKTLFTAEPIEFKDLCEAKQVTQGAMYLDFDYDRPMVLPREGMRFVGRSGLFTPIKEHKGGAVLWRIKDDKHYAVAGTKGYLWLESDMVDKNLSPDDIDMDYFQGLANEAVKSIQKFGSFDEFIGR